MTYSESIVKTITTSEQKLPSSAQAKVKNPLKKDIFVNGIELLPDPYFNRYGRCIVLINGSVVFDSSDSDKLRSMRKFPIPLQNQEFLRDKFIEVFAWNGINSNTVKLDVNIFIGEENESLSSVAIPISDDEISAVVSDFVTIFPLQLRTIASYTTLLDMKSYKKLILMMGIDVYVNPTSLIGGAGIADGNLATSGTHFGKPNAGDTFEVIGEIDFGSIASRLPKGRITNTAANGAHTITLNLEVSNNDADWTSVATLGINESVNTYNLAGVEQSFRYLRISATWIGGTGQGELEVKELYDGNIFGGTASLSFEILDESSNTWLTLISSAAIGSISQGQQVVKTIGDVINDVANDKFNYALPSTQTGFRVKLVITDSNLSISVAIQRIS